MNTGKNYNKIVHGSGISKLKAKVSTLKGWIGHPALKESQKNTGRSKLVHYIDFLSSVAIHGATLQDYLDFEFYNKSHKERSTFLTGKRQHSFFDKVNNRNKTDIFIDKNKFAQVFEGYLGRDNFTLDLDGRNKEEARLWLSDKSVVFAKPSKGVEGRGVTRLVVGDKIEEPIDFCLENNLDLIEEAIIQHEEMNVLYPDAINTVRFMTLVENGNVKILGAILRMGNGGHVDNAAEGGIYASVDVNSGVLDSIAINNSKEQYERHPITKQVIKGFQIPFWSDVIEICKKAALEVPDVRCVGWDVAITNEGPLIIEGNDRWGRFLWQLPKGQGLYHLIKQ